MQQSKAAIDLRSLSSVHLACVFHLVAIPSRIEAAKKDGDRSSEVRAMLNGGGNRGRG